MAVFGALPGPGVVRFEREAVWQQAWFARLSEGRIVAGWPAIDTSSSVERLRKRRVPPGA